MSSKEQISEWFYEYSDDIFQFLVYRTGNSDVDDLLQEVFIKAWHGLVSFQEQSSPRTWLLSIARHVAIDEQRRRNRVKVKVGRLFKENLMNQVNKVTPEEVLELKEGKKILFSAIKRLKSSYREVVILRGIKELSVTETAKILNWSENKVRSTYHRAKNKLHNELEGIMNEKGK